MNKYLIGAIVGLCISNCINNKRIETLENHSFLQGVIINTQEIIIEVYKKNEEKKENKI